MHALAKWRRRLLAAFEHIVHPALGGIDDALQGLQGSRGDPAQPRQLKYGAYVGVVFRGPLDAVDIPVYHASVDWRGVEFGFQEGPGKLSWRVHGCCR